MHDIKIATVVVPSSIGTIFWVKMQGEFQETIQECKGSFTTGEREDRDGSREKGVN